MNIQSWLLLFIIIGVCAYIIYSRFLKKGAMGDCSDCAQKNGCCEHSKSDSSSSCSCGN